jgi:hypothetical protein
VSPRQRRSNYGPVKQVAYILFGWSLTLFVSWSLGKLLLRKLCARLFRQEEDVFAFLAGSACLSVVVFFLAAMHVVYRGVFLALGILVIGLAAFSGAWRRRGEPLPRLPVPWRLLFGVIWLVFGVVYFAYALAPESSPDGSTYHLGLVARYARERGFPAITNNFYASLPEGLEMLFLFAFVWGRHSAAALVHCTYLLLLPVLILNYGSRLGTPFVGVAGGLLIFLAPIAGVAGTSAYNDVALCAIVFAVFALLEIWRDEGESSLLVLAGLLAGFAFDIKYTGFVAIPYAAGGAAYACWRSHKPILRPILLVIIPAAAFVAPTLVKNAIVVRNPVSPFFNQMFPNPYVHISFEKSWTRDLRSYDVHSFREWVFDMTTRGAKTGGVLGPVFLLAPLSLLALRRAAGRRLLLAALVFLLTYPTNVATRFLMPAATFLGPAIAMGLGSGSGVALLVALHAYLSWPSHVPWYATLPWRLRGQPLRPAMRLQPEEDYLSWRMGADYKMARLIERETPPGSRIFTLDVPPYAYCAREILPAYYSAVNQRLHDNLYAGFDASVQPLRILTFRINPQSLRGLRLVHTRTSRPITPGINEVRIFSPSGERMVSESWRLSAKPFPWDVALAFDRNPVTRWNAWQETQGGAMVEIDFGREETVSAVRLESTQDQAFVEWDLMGEACAGKWSRLPASSEAEAVPGPLDLRRQAIAELKRNGIQYLLVNQQHFEREFREHARQWGIRLAADLPGNQLYALE